MVGTAVFVGIVAIGWEVRGFCATLHIQLDYHWIVDITFHFIFLSANSEHTLIRNFISLKAELALAYREKFEFPIEFGGKILQPLFIVSVTMHSIWSNFLGVFGGCVIAAEKTKTCMGLDLSQPPALRNWRKMQSCLLTMFPTAWAMSLLQKLAQPNTTFSA